VAYKVESSGMLRVHIRLGLSRDLIMLYDNLWYAKVLSLIVIDYNWLSETLSMYMDMKKMMKLVKKKVQ